MASDISWINSSCKNVKKNLQVFVRELDIFHRWIPWFPNSVAMMRKEGSCHEKRSKSNMYIVDRSGSSNSADSNSAFSSAIVRFPSKYFSIAIFQKLIIITTSLCKCRLCRHKLQNQLCHIRESIQFFITFMPMQMRCTLIKRVKINSRRIPALHYLMEYDCKKEKHNEMTRVYMTQFIRVCPVNGGQVRTISDQNNSKK